MSLASRSSRPNDVNVPFRRQSRRAWSTTRAVYYVTRRALAGSSVHSDTPQTTHTHTHARIRRRTTRRLAERTVSLRDPGFP